MTSFWKDPKTPLQLAQAPALAVHDIATMVEHWANGPLVNDDLRGKIGDRIRKAIEDALHSYKQSTEANRVPPPIPNPGKDSLGYVIAALDSEVHGRREWSVIMSYMRDLVKLNEKRSTYKAKVFFPQGMLSGEGDSPEEILKDIQFQATVKGWMPKPSDTPPYIAPSLTYRPADGSVYNNSHTPCGLIYREGI